MYGVKGRTSSSAVHVVSAKVAYRAVTVDERKREERTQAALQQHAPDHQKHLGKTESVASIRPMCLPACVRAYEISLSFSPMMMRTLLATREQQNQLISRAHASTFNLRARARTNGRTDERTVLRAINGR